MSASLVGSEMCIRDRTRGDHGASIGPVDPPSSNSGGLRGVSVQSGYKDCLLYTSDAADDM
eukprot:9986094-Alexandrium_andersonii.AAC.1